MRILIYGHKGWIGQQFLELLCKSDSSYMLGKSRCDDLQKMTDEFETFKPTHCIAFIGRTHGPGFPTIDYLEQPGKLVDNLRDNLYSPLALARVAMSFLCHFTYLGTGCIFEYDQVHPIGSPGFIEEDVPNFHGSSYSVVKGFTDQIFSNMHPECLNLRIRMPITFCDSPRNFITKITAYEKICSVPNSMSVLPSLLPRVLDMMSMNIKGTMNLTNPGSMSHNEVLELYRDIVDPNFRWDNFTVEEQDKLLAARRSNNRLCTGKLTELFPNIPNIKTAVVGVLKMMRYTRGLGADPR